MVRNNFLCKIKRCKNCYLMLFCVTIAQGIDKVVEKKAFLMNINNLKVLLTSLPGRYASALFAEGKKTESLHEILENFQTLEVFFEHNVSLKKFLTNSCSSEKELDSAWVTIGEKLSFCPVFLSFVREVVKNHRFSLFGNIRHIFYIALAKHHNKRDIAIVSVVDLLPEQKQRIEKILEAIVSAKAIIRYEIDESLVGGILIKSEEIVIDASVAAQLKQLSCCLKNEKIKD